MSRVEQKVLKWFGHVERMDDSRFARRVMIAALNGGRVRGRPRFGWMEGGLGQQRDDGGGCAAMRER